MLIIWPSHVAHRAPRLLAPICEVVCEAGRFVANAGDSRVRQFRAMFYFFRRGVEKIRCEVRTDSDGRGYELVVDRPGAMVRVEHFGEPPELNRRWSEI